MKKITFKGVLKAINSYIVFFISIGFAVSCCMMLFLSIFSDTMGVEFTAVNINTAAKITFLNVLIITALFGICDFIRRKIMVDRPVKLITNATEKITNGDFSIQINPLHGSGVEGFNKIITAINTMGKELNSVETLRTDFISNVSHEMKTPLAVIQNYATLLQSPDLTEEQRYEYAKAITASSKRLSEMMTNILKLNRLENQSIFPSAEKFNLSEQLCECLVGFENVWEDKKIDIETDISEDVLINADSELLSLVWNNLFSNAFKFTPKGGKVTVSLTATENHATIKVTDTGCGMTKEVGEHIFEKFYQGDTSRASQGNGLGLALVKRVIDILHGEISVESALNKGSTFTVRIRRNLNGL